MTEDGKALEAIHELRLVMQQFSDDLNAFKADMVQRVDRIEKKSDSLHKIVAGNGSSDSILMRLILAETRLASVEKRQQEVCQKQDEQTKQFAIDIDELQETEVAWRNRLVGIVSFLALVNVILAAWAILFR